MFEFDIQRCSRVCAATGEPIGAGQSYYAVLQWEEGQVVRKDYRPEAWDGPPEEAIGWWRSTVPAPPASGPQWAPDEVLVRYFEELGGRQDQALLRYVLALLLVRRRVLRLVDEESTAEQLVVRAPQTDATYHVTAIRPAPEELEPLERHLRRLLVAEPELGGEEGTPHGTD